MQSPNRTKELDGPNSQYSISDNDDDLTMMKVGEDNTKVGKQIAASEPRRPLKEIKVFDRHWVIKATVLRKGNPQPFNNPNGWGQFWKVILMDEQGTAIEAVMFNKGIEQFKKYFEKGETYYISNGFAKAVNKRYTNANKDIELRFNDQTQVDVAEDKISPGKFRYEFVDLNSIKLLPKSSNVIDVTGTVTKVHKQEDCISRRITITDERSQSILITLRGDLASNEGSLLEKNYGEGPKIALSKVSIKTYAGNVCLWTTPATTLIINPTDEAITLNAKWKIINEPENKAEGSGIGAHTDAVEMTLPYLIQTPQHLLKDTFGYFTARVESIRIPDQPWYYACTKCKRKMVSTDNKLQCPKCSTSAHYPRYLLKMWVTDGKRKAYVTLFDAAETLFGCSLAQFIETCDKEGSDTKIKQLKTAIGSSYIFFVDVERMKASDRMAGRVIAEKLQPAEPGSRLERLEMMK